jgi:tetratricopeptide (TPR) repeat protein
VRQRTGASFDLGLALFELGERYGERFDAEPKQEAPADPQRDAKRSAEVDCALRIVQIVANDSKTPVDLRAHAHYLAGNLEFLRQDYRAAVDAYDRALRLVPGLEGDKGDPVGRNAAFNRAIALRRLEEEKPPDAGPPPTPDGGDDQNDGGQRDGDGGQDPSKNDDKRPDGGPPQPNPSSQDGGAGQNEPKPEPDKADSKQEPSAQNKPQQTPGQPSAAPAQPSLSQDERLLDMLEQAPTVQQEAAKKSATRRRGVVMEDK